MAERQDAHQQQAEQAGREGDCGAAQALGQRAGADGRSDLDRGRRGAEAEQQPQGSRTLATDEAGQGERAERDEIALGMKVIRVTENTTMVAKASSA